MSLRFISNSTSPNYTALSTDIVSTNITTGSVVTSYDSIAGLGLIGGTVYCVDNGAWHIIDSVENTLVLRDFQFPTSGSPV